MKGTIKINCALCKGCGYCIEACPKGVITLTGELKDSGIICARAEHMDKCTGCALCAEVCPDVAIEVWREKG